MHKEHYLHSVLRTSSYYELIGKSLTDQTVNDFFLQKQNQQ